MRGLDALAEVGLYDMDAFLYIPSATNHCAQAAAVLTKGFHATIGCTPIAACNGDSAAAGKGVH